VAQDIINYDFGFKTTTPEHDLTIISHQNNNRIKRLPGSFCSRVLRRATKLTLLPLLVKDKAQHAVVLDKEKSDRLNKEVNTYRLITVATLVDRMKINGSVARKVLKDMENEGKIKKVVSHARLNVYSMSWMIH